MSSGEISLTPTAPKQRQLLALLLAVPNSLVSVHTCVEELWESNPPESARSTLQTYVMHLRRSLARCPDSGGRAGAKRLLQTQDRGYRIAVLPGQLDTQVFDDRVRRARALLATGDDRRGSALLAEALSVWRGPTLSGLTIGPVLQAHVVGLEEYRLTVLEQRIEADLRLGRHHELLQELRALTTQHPVHENLHAQLMVALYRSGRSAQALTAYRRLRQVLSEELGLEPSPRMCRLHQAVLACDPALDAPVATDSPLSMDLRLKSA
ncbi:AfsR/SARP family transcriptional regulator [Streptomyces sp. NPDC048182]|uniref:AfsR/SARP family transcriptional regulator n=1 Tax=unclassified Streptomyces TaxID=2593676 RepID=UPI0033AD9863